MATVGADEENGVYKVTVRAGKYLYLNKNFSKKCIIIWKRNL